MSPMCISHASAYHDCPSWLAWLEKDEIVLRSEWPLLNKYKDSYCYPPPETNMTMENQPFNL